MPPAPNQPPSPLASILHQLACPACSSPLALEVNSLTCVACGRVYPIIDGIPVLIPDAADQNQ